jgi:hypothetical protein
MLFPKDRPMYPRLLTSFTRFDALIAELENASATCCLHTEFVGLQGWIFFGQGEPLGSLAREGTARHTGPQAARRIHSRADHAGGVLGVYGLEEDVARLLAGCIDAAPVYEGLSTDFASPDRLIARLREDGHSGHIDITLSDGRGEGLVLLDGGAVVKAMLVSDGQTFAGPDVIQSIVQLAANLGAVFNVYRTGAVAAGAGAPAEQAGPPADPADLAMFWSEMLSRAQRTVDRIAPGRFAEAFAEVMAERGDGYPYLAPDAGNFSYRDGAAAFAGDPPADVSGELGDCLLDTLARLAFRLKRADLESRVLADVSDLHMRHPDMAERLPQRAQALVS